MFSLTLPRGEYEITFIDEQNKIIWPKFVREQWRSTLPSCDGSVSQSDITITEPDTECSNLFFNGDVEDGAGNFKIYLFMFVVMIILHPSQLIGYSNMHTQFENMVSILAT